jgi:hypothetical protein
MELFPASTLKQWEMIKKLIDTSDYYILIIGLRYGTISPNYEDEVKKDISYTQKEYEYAFSKGIPIYTFFRDENEPVTDDKKENTSKKRKKLESFKKAIKSNGYYYEYWQNPFDLSQKILNALNIGFIDCPRLGWIRSRSETSELVIDQLEKSKNELLKLYLKGNWRCEWRWEGGGGSEIAKITADGSYIINGVHFFTITHIEYNHGVISFRKKAIQSGDNRDYINRLHVSDGLMLTGAECFENNKFIDIKYERSIANCLSKNEEINVGDCIMSLNKEYKLCMQHDGNLVLYNSKNKAIWSSETNGLPIKKCVLQADNKLTLIDDNNNIKWQSKSNSKSSSYLLLNNDGSLVINKVDGQLIWKNSI